MSTLIAGGGLAGAAAACILGSEATLIERSSTPYDKVCGEFISWDALTYLTRLGIDPFVLGASRIEAVRLVYGRIVVQSNLPGLGLSLSRRVLDEALLNQAARNGATIMRGYNIRRFVQGGLDVETLGPLQADRIFLATGKHDLRNAKRGSHPSQLVGLKMYYRLSPEQAAELAGSVEIILFPGGYAGLQPVEAGLVNLCLLVDRAIFKASGSTWRGFIAHLITASPHLANRLRNAEAQSERSLAVFGVPYGFIHRDRPADPRDLFRLGDQMGVIPSFSGDGMAVALHTAEVAATADDSHEYHIRTRRNLQGQIACATALHRFGQSRPRLLTTLVRAWPGALSWVARLTRVRSSCPI